MFDCCFPSIDDKLKFLPETSVSQITRHDNILQWIPRAQNWAADYISKYCNPDDRSVSSSIFDIFNKKWGLYTFDRFADTFNTKCL